MIRFNKVAIWIFFTSIVLISCSKRMPEQEKTSIVTGLSDLVTQDGIGIYRYGQQMDNVSPGNDKVSDLAIWLWKGIDIPQFENSRFNIYAISESPNGNVDNFRIQIVNNANPQWINDVIDGLINQFKSRGFKVLKRQKNGEKNAILLADDQFNVFIMNNCDTEVEVITGYHLVNSKIYNEFYNIFLSAQTGGLM